MLPGSESKAQMSLPGLITRSATQCLIVSGKHALHKKNTLFHLFQLGTVLPLAPRCPHVLRYYISAFDNQLIIHIERAPFHGQIEVTRGVVGTA